MKFFNTVGITLPDKHYFLPHRLDWNQLTNFIDKEYYFILHAPRQSGKTTAIIEFVNYFNQQDRYTALYLSTEPAHHEGTDVKQAIKAILIQFKEQISIFLPAEINALAYLDLLLSQEFIEQSSLYSFLKFWSHDSVKPLALFLDEFDGLVGDSLIAILKQFRTGYTNRPRYFPQSVCLIGIRDLRDYKIKSKLQEEMGVLYSPFNIKAESLLLPNFTQEDVKNLYEQHTKETGQIFTPDAIEYAYYLTQGQPWLVNALAYQACFRDVQDRSQAITKEIINKAKEALIGRRDTHLDALTDRLKETRIRRIIDAIISGDTGPADLSTDDLQYVRDLGLITQKGVAIANPIYQEIIPRALTYARQELITNNPSLYKNSDGSFNTNKMLEALGQFFRENAEIWQERFDYKESGPHLLVMAFLQRIINGGGEIDREYALGTKRVDILIKWTPINAQGLIGKQQRIVIELKVLRDKHTIAQAVKQTAEYMDKANATEGHIIIFDSDKTKSWDEKIYHRLSSSEDWREYVDKKIDIWGM